uniref:Reverse transcriptase domain-containing protein n=1 Tax=Tanacetum cinerariifolium TaxID=118510 RepID=A0A6L2N7C3_TANCI|nr:reverse transcriptase domain-containing protein [Tanacetum cinerariifolium]
MADQRTMAELLRASTEGYAEAIVVPSILAEQFELKHSLINMINSDQFFGLEKDNPHDHICWFNKITSTIKYKDVPNSEIKLMLFPFSLAGAACRWLEKELLHSIHTWEDLVSKFINEFFPPQEQQISVKKSLIFNNEIAKLTHAVNQQTSAVTTAMTASLKQFQATPPLASVKAFEEIYVTYGGAHPYYQCLAAGMANQIRPLGFTQPNVQNNQNRFGQPQGFNRGNNFNLEQSYQALTQQNQIVPLNELEKVKRMNEANMKAMQTQINMVKNKLRNEMKNSIQDSLSNQTNEIKNMMASLFQMNTASTSSYSNQPQKESINLINVFNNSSEDFLEDLFSNQPSGNPTFSSHLELTSLEVQNDIFDLEAGNVLPKKLLDLDSTKDLHSPPHVIPLSGSTTYSSSPKPLLEELADELALITFPLKYNDDLYNLANPADNFVDSMPEMFTDEHALDYSSPSICDEYDDDFLKVKTDTENVYDDHFDSKGEKIKESKLLIDELDRPCDFLPPSDILIQEKPFEIITRVVQDKKLATSNASLVLEDFDPPFYEPLFFKEVPRSNMLLPFSSENEEKVFKPGIHTSKKFILLLSQNYLIKAIKFSKSTKFLKAR